MIVPIHTPHRTWEDCVQRYPLLTRALQWVLIGSQSEAGCVLRDYRDGFPFSCEACSHSGLSPADRVRHASSEFVRRAVRQEHARWKARCADPRPEDIDHTANGFLPPPAEPEPRPRRTGRHVEQAAQP
jgi:hypothetical protein